MSQFIAATLHCPDDSCSKVMEVLLSKLRGSRINVSTFIQESVRNQYAT
jgi:hypothetical protein